MTKELTLEQQIRNEQGTPEGEQWEFDVPRLQEAIENGTAWRLEGSVGRAAADALKSGACFLPSIWSDGAERPLTGESAHEFEHLLKPPMRDYFGNVIPYRELLQPGTKGTLENSARFYGI